MRLAPVIATLSLLAMLPTSALAGDSAIAAQARAKLHLDCDAKEGRDVGRCISDTLKKWSVLLDEYNDLEEIARKKWHDEHAYLGATPEYRKQLNAFLTDLKNQRAAFLKTQNQTQKTSQETWRLRRSSNIQEKIGTTFESKEVTAAEEKCSAQKDKTAKRLCLRNILRNPNERASARIRK